MGAPGGWHGCQGTLCELCKLLSQAQQQHPAASISPMPKEPQHQSRSGSCVVWSNRYWACAPYNNAGLSDRGRGVHDVAGAFGKDRSIKLSSTTDPLPFNCRVETETNYLVCCRPVEWLPKRFMGCVPAVWPSSAAAPCCPSSSLLHTSAFSKPLKV